MAIPVTEGDILTLKGWSNATASLRAIVNFKPAAWFRRFFLGLSKLLVQGSESYSINVDVDVASSRAQATANYTILEDGEIADAVINYQSATALVRGQTYSQLILQRTGTTLSACSLLAAGYLFGGNTNGGHLPSLNHIDEPGPAGGHGHFREITTADPAGGSEIPNQTVPTGSLWRLISFSVQLVQGITQTPLPTLRIQTGTPITMVQIPITTIAISASSTAQLTWAIGLVQSSFTAIVGDEFHTAPLPKDYIAIPGEIINTLTDGIGANTNYGPATFLTEEWVMPN